MIGNGQRHTPSQFYLAFLDKAVDIFHHVNNLKGETYLRIKPFKGVVTLSTRCDHRLHSGISPCPGVFSGKSVQLFTVSPLVNPAAAA